MLGDLSASPPKVLDCDSAPGCHIQHTNFAYCRSDSDPHVVGDSTIAAKTARPDGE